MAGLGVRVYTDEMMDPDVAVALTQRGYDVLSCHAAGRAGQGISDDAQLEFAAQTNRAILSLNVRDFVPLDARWKAAGQHHAGIILIATAIPLGHLIRCVARHLDSVPPSIQEDTALWLDTSP